MLIAAKLPLWVPEGHTNNIKNRTVVAYTLAVNDIIHTSGFWYAYGGGGLEAANPGTHL